MIILYIRDFGVICMLECEIIKKKRVDILRYLSAHIMIDARDKEARQLMLLKSLLLVILILI